MAEHNTVLFKLDRLVPPVGKNEWESKPSLSSSPAVPEKPPTTNDAKSHQIEIYVTPPDVAGMVNVRLRMTAVVFTLIAALIVGFNKDDYRSDSRFDQQPYLSYMLTLNVILCLYSLRVWKLGMRMKRKNRNHVAVVALSCIYVFDQVFGYLLVTVCACVWTSVRSQHCLTHFSQGYCQRAQVGVVMSFLGLVSLQAPSVITFCRLAGKVRGGLIVAKASARWQRKLWQ